MKRGMPKTEAKERIASGEFTWEDLRRLLEITHPTLKGEAGEARSRVNKTMSLAASFNVHWRALRGKSGEVYRHHDQMIAVNLLRDFGDSKPEVRLGKPLPKPYHAKLIDIHNDEPPQLKYWTRNDVKYCWESNDGDWSVYDQWTCGRITMCRPDRATEDNPAWNEIYAFAESQIGGSITDGRQ